MRYNYVGYCQSGDFDSKKVKIVLVDPVEAYWVTDIQFYHLLTSAPDGCNWLPSGSCRFIPEERVHVTRWLGEWIGHRIGPHILENTWLKLRNTI
jgi:hypothetical protein